MKVRALLMVATLTVAACGGAPETPGAAAPKDPPSVAKSASPSNDLKVTVSLGKHALGSVHLGVSPLKPAKANDSEAWLTHSLIFHNAGKEAVTFVPGGYPRTSMFLKLEGEPRLLVADEGCGYGRDSDDGPVNPGVCDAYGDRLQVPPDAARARDITLFRDLEGMAPLAPGRYVFRKEIRLAAGDKRVGAIVPIVYNVKEAPAP